jgi:ArsR family transcriptional regulator, lead/cadmium/zinc/bismuth-responsive transcriptional repressor
MKMARKSPACKPGDHEHPPRPGEATSASLERAASLFKAMGEAPRLRILELLMQGEWCVTELVEAVGEKFSTVSQRLRVLRNERLVSRRREGTHLFYALSDLHVADLLQNALAHAAEETPSAATKEEDDE